MMVTETVVPAVTFAATTRGTDLVGSPITVAATWSPLCRVTAASSVRWYSFASRVASGYELVPDAPPEQSKSDATTVLDWPARIVAAGILSPAISGRLFPAPR